MRGNHREWELDAACREYPTEIFFGDEGWTTDNQMAVDLVCSVCPVRQECLEAALWEERDAVKRRHGIRGGMSANQRHAYWLKLLERGAGWCGRELHIMERNEEECLNCRREAMRKTA